MMKVFYYFMINLDDNFIEIISFQLSSSNIAIRPSAGFPDSEKTRKREELNRQKTEANRSKKKPEEVDNDFFLKLLFTYIGLEVWMMNIS